MEFGLDTTSAMSEEKVTTKQTEQQNTTVLSDHDMELLMSMHCYVFTHLASSSWFHGDTALLPNVNIVWPYLLAYRSASVLICHCAHVLGMSIS